jgi:hypothetical protein
MRYSLAALLALTGLPASAEFHEDVPAVQSQPTQSPPPTHRVPLSVVILRGSRWTYDVVQRRVAKAREIIAQCGVRLDPAFIELSSPGGGAGVLYKPASSGEPGGMGTLARALGQPKPILFYVERFADNSGQSGTARPPHTSAGTDEVDTAWIAFTESNADGSGRYQVDAHELVHMLADVGHVGLGENRPPRRNKEDPIDPADLAQGLMVGNPILRSNRLSPALCARLKARTTARPL